MAHENFKKNGLRQHAICLTNHQTFHIFISLWGRVWPFIWANLSPFTLRCFVPKSWKYLYYFAIISPESPLPKDTLCQVCLKLAQCRKYFYYFVTISPFGKGVTNQMNKFESPSPKEALCHVWLKLAKWPLRRRWKCEKFTMPTTTRPWH